MKRTQIQLPDPLYEEVKRVAELLDWSVAEVIRRGAEHMARCYPATKRAADEWQLPDPLPLGEFVAPIEAWRELANASGEAENDLG